METTLAANDLAIKTKVKEPTVTYCQSMRIVNMSEPVIAYYNAFQKDFQLMFTQLLKWSGWAYAYRNDEMEYVYVSQEQNQQDLHAVVGDHLYERLLNEVAQTFAASGTDRSSCYGLINNAYGENGKVGKVAKGKYKDFLAELKNKAFDDPVLQRKLRGGTYKKVSIEDWKKYHESLQQDKDIWPELEARFSRTFGPKAIQVRNRSPIPVTFPNDKDYCTILADRVGDQVCSYFASCQEYQKETQEMQRKFAEQDTPTFQLLKQFGEVIEQLNYGLTKTVINDLIKNRVGRINDAVRIQWMIPAYDALRTAPAEIIWKSYHTYKLYKQIERRLPLPSIPNFKNDQQMSVGLSSRGKFALTIENGNLAVTINDLPKMTCMKSHYFSNLSLTEVKDTNRLIGYELTFCQSLKLRTPTGFKDSDKVKKKVTGVVKEIRIQKRGQHYYLYLPHSIKVDIDNKKLAWFFRTADYDAFPAEELKNLPDTALVGSVDMNMTNPLAICKARISKKGPTDIPITPSHVYASASLVESPRHLVKNSIATIQLKEISREWKELSAALRNLKSSRFNNEEVSEETAVLLENENRRNYHLMRDILQKKSATLRTRLRTIHQSIFKSGYNNVGDAIYLLEALDYEYSFLKSYINLHTRQGDVQQYPPSSMKRINFKDFLLKKIASIVCEAMIDCSVVFIENLESEFDRDKDNNSLTRLFTGKGLVHALTNALRKQKIEPVEVDKRGTSKLNPFDRSMSYRPNPKDISPNDRNKLNEQIVRYITDKTIMFVRYKKKIYQLDSDLAAACNILLSGLNHQIIPYRFAVSKGRIGKDTEEGAKDVGKRLKKFAEICLTGDTRLVMTPRGIIPKFVDNITAEDRVVNLKKNKEEAYLYVHAGCYYLKAQHDAMKDEIKNYVLDIAKQVKDVAEFNQLIPRIDITPESVFTYF